MTGTIELSCPPEEDEYILGMLARNHVDAMLNKSHQPNRPARQTRYRPRTTTPRSVPESVPEKKRGADTVIRQINDLMQDIISTRKISDDEPAQEHNIATALVDEIAAQEGPRVKPQAEEINIAAMLLNDERDERDEVPLTELLSANSPITEVVDTSPATTSKVTSLVMNATGRFFAGLGSLVPRAVHFTRSFNARELLKDSSTTKLTCIMAGMSILLSAMLLLYLFSAGN